MPLNAELNQKAKAMNPQLLACILALSASGSAFALTFSDLSPSALDGSILTFTDTTGRLNFGRELTWQARFIDYQKGRLKIIRVDDFPVNISVSFSDSLGEKVRYITLDDFLDDKKPVTLSLRVENGIGYYEMSRSDQFMRATSGTFEIRPKKLTPREISVQEPGNDPWQKLEDGKSIVQFGTDGLGNPSYSYTLSIKNRGTTTLKGLRIVKTGADRSMFEISKLRTTVLPPGKKTDFSITYTGLVPEEGRAKIHIFSNDKDENPFDFRVVFNPPDQVGAASPD